MGSNPVQAWIFFRPYFHYCLSSAHNCEDHFHSRQYLLLHSIFQASFIELSLPNLWVHITFVLLYVWFNINFFLGQTENFPETRYSEQFCEKSLNDSKNDETIQMLYPVKWGIFRRIFSSFFSHQLRPLPLNHETGLSNPLDVGSERFTSTQGRFYTEQWQQRR